MALHFIINIFNNRRRLFKETATAPWAGLLISLAKGLFYLVQTAR